MANIMDRYPQRATVTGNADINTILHREGQIHYEVPLSWLGLFGNDPKAIDVKYAWWRFGKWAQVTLVSKVGIHHLWMFVGRGYVSLSRP